MPTSTSGVYTLPQPAFVSGTTISSAAVNGNFADIEAALNGTSNGSTGVARSWGGTSTGTAAALVIAPAITATGYLVGQRYVFLAGITNAAAATLAVSAQVAVPLLGPTGAAIESGVIQAGAPYEVVYTGAAFQVLAGRAAAALSPGFLLFASGII
jgi:hypothetical protein